jgi:hypothetical protein
MIALGRVVVEVDRLVFQILVFVFWNVLEGQKLLGGLVLGVYSLLLLLLLFLEMVFVV